MKKLKNMGYIKRFLKFAVLLVHRAALLFHIIICLLIVKQKLYFSVVKITVTLLNQLDWT